MIHRFSRFAGLLNRLAVQVALLTVAALIASSAHSVEQKTAAAKQIPVLCWHDVRDASELARAGLVDPTTVALGDLIEQFELIRTLGFTPISLAQWRAARAGHGELPEKPVLLTFDDGDRSLYTLVFPLLKAYKFPAVAAIVSDWIDANSATDLATDSNRPAAAALVSWSQLREMTGSGLIEVASHTHALHHGVPGNPQGNLQPAVVTRVYRDGRYESEVEYARRLLKDLRTSRQLIAERLGETPRAIIWPYGERNALTTRLAAQAGYSEAMTLGQGSNASDAAPLEIRRNLMQGHHRATDFIRMLQSEPIDPIAALGTLRGLSLTIDEIYDPQPQQQEVRLSAWIARIIDTGVNTVTLRSWADDGGDGQPDHYYFPNERAPLRADVFNRVAWQIRQRANVKVIAELKLTDADLGDPVPLRQAFDSLLKHANFAGIALVVDTWGEPRVAMRHANELFARVQQFRPDLFTAVSIDGRALAQYTDRRSADTAALTDELVANLLVLRIAAPPVWTELRGRWINELIALGAAQSGLLHRMVFEVTAAAGAPIGADGSPRSDIASLDQLLASPMRHLSLRQHALLTDLEASDSLRRRLSTTTQQNFDQRSADRDARRR